MNKSNTSPRFVCNGLLEVLTVHFVGHEDLQLETLSGFGSRICSSWPNVQCVCDSFHASKGMRSKADARGSSRKPLNKLGLTRDLNS